MQRQLKINLACCGQSELIAVDHQALRAGHPNEVRKTVICPACGNLVILDFRGAEDDLSQAAQEVIATGG